MPTWPSEMMGRPGSCRYTDPQTERPHLGNPSPCRTGGAGWRGRCPRDEGSAVAYQPMEMTKDDRSLFHPIRLVIGLLGLGSTAASPHCLLSQGPVPADCTSLPFAHWLLGKFDHRETLRDLERRSRRFCSLCFGFTPGIPCVFFTVPAFSSCRPSCPDPTSLWGAPIRAGALGGPCLRIPAPPFVPLTPDARGENSFLQ